MALTPLSVRGEQPVRQIGVHHVALSSNKRRSLSMTC